VTLPVGFSTFCDDIRFEQQNKFSLIGCYGPEMTVYQQPPAFLPKFGILLHVRLPVQSLPEKTVMVFVPGSEEPVFKMTIPADDPNIDQKQPFPDPNPSEDVEKSRGMIVPMVFGGFAIPQAGYIRVRVTYGSERVRAGALKVIFQPPAEAAAPALPAGQAAP
jgi:hypothetical protein